MRPASSLVETESPEASVGRIFEDALRSFATDRPVLLLGHNDVDGLTAIAILGRALERAGRPVSQRIVGRGENAWSADMRAELAPLNPAGVIVCDLGVGDGRLAGSPTVVVDHHVPRVDGGEHVISGFAMDPIPTTSLLAYWCARRLGPAEDLLWLAALGLVGDMAEDFGFPEMTEARQRYGVTALRTCASLINAARRRGSGDASPALRLLMKCDSPKEVLAGDHPETAELLEAKAEVAEALQAARRVAPKVRNGVALIRFASPCQIHPLIAQQWRGRLRNEVVLAANSGFRPGWVHFAARSAQDLDLIDFLARHAPPGADENYGSGHRAATGGALRPADWNIFIRSLGFDATEEVAA